MSCSKKTLNAIKYGFNGNKNRKIGVNYWRFFFNAISVESSQEQQFYIELEMINPWLSPKEVILGYKPRITIKEEDLQYALAGTDSAKQLQTESIEQPSYCALRVGKLGSSCKQLCSYFPIKEVKFNSKKFEIEIGNKFFSGDRFSGFINISEAMIYDRPELLCDSGSANWNISYEIEEERCSGINKKYLSWFPAGIKTRFAGKINFDGIDYIVDPKRCFGYMDRFYGSDFPDTWYHISSANFTSIISGNHLFNSAIAVQGVAENMISFLGKFEDIRLNMCKVGTKKYESIWSCVQAPETDDEKENRLHWSVSVHNKVWVIDIDVYCKLTDLYNRKLESSYGKRKVLSIVEGSNCTGEVRLYKKNKTDIEQIEYARIEKAVCQFGHIEEFED